LPPSSRYADARRAGQWAWSRRFRKAVAAEPSQDAIAQVLRNIALETRHRFGGNSLMEREDIAPFLGVELSRCVGRVDQIAEQDCQVAPLAFGWSGLPDLPGTGLSLSCS